MTRDLTLANNCDDKNAMNCDLMVKKYRMAEA
ncbi:hypothetical protein Sbal223_3923 [Shewanella baltica OS223]|nr:hypothetical protein Sbal223_3923 [Shewanella baltica OS223]